MSNNRQFRSRKFGSTLMAAFTVVAGLFLVGLHGVAHAANTTYYISSAGSDSNAGTSTAKPWKTLARANSQSFGPGDKILLNGGNTFAGYLYFAPGESGTAAAPITVSNYGTGTPTIAPTNTAGIYAYDAAGIAISNVNIYGNASTYTSKPGIQFYNDLAGNTQLPYVRVTSVDVKSFTNGFLMGAATGSSGYQDVQVTYSTLHDNRDSGLSTYGATFNSSSPNYAISNIYVGHVTAYNNLGNAANTTSNSGSGIILGSVSGGTVERSVAYANGSSCKASECGVGIWAYNANNVTLQYNESHDNKTGGTADGDGFDLDVNVSNSLVQYNYSHGNDGAGYLLYTYYTNALHTGNTVRYNISANDGRKNKYGGIDMSGTISNTNLYNNVVYMQAPSTSYSPAVVLGTASSSNTFRNNIFYTVGTTPTIVSSGPALTQVDFQDNDYYNTTGAVTIYWGSATYTSLATWRTATYQEVLSGVATGYSVDPLFVSPGTITTLNNADNLSTFGSYKLQNSSPLIDKGLNLQTNFGINPGTTDFYGQPMPHGANPELGIYEYQG